MAYENPTPAATVDPASVYARIDSTAGTCNNNNNNVVEISSSVTSGTEKSLVYADELMEKGYKANDFSQAVDCFSRALEIRVAHYGELAPICVRTYYKYGQALMYKAQENIDLLVSGAVSKNKANAEPDSEKGSAKGAETEEDQDDQRSSADERIKSAHDLAWKILDLIPENTMEEVDVLSACASMDLKRGYVKTSLSNYLKALSILRSLVEPDNHHTELNFRICICLESLSTCEEAIPYCQKAISVCKSHLQRLKSELESSSSGSKVSSESEPTGLLGQQSSSSLQTTDSVAEKEKEIKILTGISAELEKKLEIVSDPSSRLSVTLRILAAKGKSGQTSDPNGDSHLGVVGRGVKRVNMSSVATESTAAKKRASSI